MSQVPDQRIETVRNTAVYNPEVQAAPACILPCLAAVLETRGCQVAEAISWTVLPSVTATGKAAASPVRTKISGTDDSSWTQAGHLTGRVRKMRVGAVATPGAASLALLPGYVSGLRGELLFKSDFTRLLDCSYQKTIELAETASRRGWISLRRVGQVIEVLFPNLITAQEMEWLHEQN